jgi:hypothetical protein
MTTKKRQPSGTDFHVRNDILHALLNSEYKHLSPKLEQVALQRGEIIYQADQRRYLAIPDCLQATQRHRGPSVACEIGHRVDAVFAVKLWSVSL